MPFCFPFRSPLTQTSVAMSSSDWAGAPQAIGRTLGIDECSLDSGSWENTLDHGLINKNEILGSLVGIQMNGKQGPRLKLL